MCFFVKGCGNLVHLYIKPRVSRWKSITYEFFQFLTILADFGFSTQLIDYQRLTRFWLSLENALKKNFLGWHPAFSSSFCRYPSHPFALYPKRLRLCVGRIFVVTASCGGLGFGFFEVRHRKLGILKKFSEFSRLFGGSAYRPEKNAKKIKKVLKYFVH